MKISRKIIGGGVALLIVLSVFSFIAIRTYVEDQQADLLARITDLEASINQLQNQISETENSLTVSEEIVAQQRDQIESLNQEIAELGKIVDRLNGDDVPAPARKTAYLTFDDGPSQLTYQILDILAEHQIKATFFVNGHNDAESIELYKAIQDAGHVIGNHTYSHYYPNIYASADAFMEDVYRLDELLYTATGVRPHLIRFPGGSSSSSLTAPVRNAIIRRLFTEGYQYFDWNVDGKDSLTIVQTPEQIINNVATGALKQDAAVILLHDRESKVNTVTALPAIIDQLTEQGYEFDVLTINSPTIQHRKLTS